MQANLIENGDFENPGVGPRHFDWFSSIPGWQASEGLIEIQVSEGRFGGRQVVGQSLLPGEQFVELDASANGAMFQDVPTVVGQGYELTFQYSPRNGWDGRAWPPSTNVIDVYWEGTLLDSLSAQGPNTPVNEWNLFTYDVTANPSNGSSRLAFAAGGISDARGGLIDKVTLVAHPVPEPTSGHLWFGLTIALVLRSAVRNRRRQLN